MDKNVLKERLEEVKNNLITNSKDAHWAKNAIDELLSLKGQLEHEPTLVYLPVKDVENKLEGDTFEISVMKDGSAVYRTYGGLTIVAKPNLTTLVETMEYYIDITNQNTTMTDEERELFNLDLSAFGYVMSLPIFAFSDSEFTYSIASKIVEYLRTTYDDLIGEDLHEEAREDIELNERFKDANLAIQEMNEEIKKIGK